MNIVMVSHGGHQKYVCAVPSGVTFHKGDVVEVHKYKSHRDPYEATCVTDSMDVSMDVVEILNNGKTSVKRVAILRDDENEDIECGIENISILL